MSNVLVANKYNADLMVAFDELQRYVAEREALETKIAKQKKRISALLELAYPDNPPISGLVEGVTDACRTVLRGAIRPLFPAEIRNQVEALGITNQQNLLASVHTILKRLKESDEIEEVLDPEGTGATAPAYRWVGRNLANLRALMGLIPPPSGPTFPIVVDRGKKK